MRVWKWKAWAGRRETTHRVAHRRLQRSVLFGLAADVEEGEQQMVVVCQVGRNLHFNLLIELRRPLEVRVKHNVGRMTQGRWRDSNRRAAGDGALLVVVDDGGVRVSNELGTTRLPKDDLVKQHSISTVNIEMTINNI